MLADLQLEADGWAQSRQQCAECKELLTAAVVTAADVHKSSLDAASAATVKYSPGLFFSCNSPSLLCFLHHLRYITEVFNDRSNAFSAVTESRVARAAAVADAMLSPDVASSDSEVTARLVEVFDRPIALAPPAGPFASLNTTTNP